MRIPGWAGHSHPHARTGSSGQVHLRQTRICIHSHHCMRTFCLGKRHLTRSFPEHEFPLRQLHFVVVRRHPLVVVQVLTEAAKHQSHSLPPAQSIPHFPRGDIDVASSPSSGSPTCSTRGACRKLSSLLSSSRNWSSASSQVSPRSLNLFCGQAQAVG